MQDTFVKALMNINHFRGTCKIATWLCQIAKNTLYRELKKPYAVSLDISKQTLIYDIENNLHELFDLIDSINEPYRTVFTLRSWVGLEFLQIAKRYGKSENWARVTYHRARLKLKQLFE